MPETKILALDVGKKRIGLAVSDDLGIIAQGLPTLERSNLKNDITSLNKLVDEYKIQKIVVGLPINMDGTQGPQAQLVLDFIESVKGEISIPVITWDERLSTQAAQRPLMEAGLKWKKRRKVIDKLAAVLILQNYLDHKKHIQHPRSTSPNPYKK